jgi:hypothetical protein
VPIDVQWKLWVGARMGWIDMSAATDRTDKILEKVYAGSPYYEVSGGKIEAIRMHGQIVGLGIGIATLSWTSGIEDENVFDSKKLAEANSLVPRLQKLFSDLGMAAQILVMHHVDIISS